MSARYFAEDNGTDTTLLHAYYDDEQKGNRTLGIKYDGNEDVCGTVNDFVSIPLEDAEEFCTEVSSTEFDTVKAVQDEWRIGGIPKKPNLIS